jgi:FMN-dependent NADH-azoreductase
MISLSHSKIYEWIDHHFNTRRTFVCDEERSGRLSTSRTVKSIQAVGTMVRENR